MTSGLDHPTSQSIVRTYSATVGSNGDKSPLGVRIVEPPAATRQAERGKFFAVVDLSGSNPQREQMIEQLLGVAQRTYFAAKGKQSAVLMECIHETMAALNDFNNRNNQPLNGGVICAGLIQNRLMIASGGAAFALLNVAGRVEMFPLQAQNVSGAIPDVLRREVMEGDAIFLGSAAWETAVSMRTLAGTVAHIDPDNRFDAASGLVEQVGGSVPPGLFLVISTEKPTSAAESPRAISPFSPQRRSNLGGLPTSFGPTGAGSTGSGSGSGSGSGAGSPPLPGSAEAVRNDPPLAKRDEPANSEVLSTATQSADLPAGEVNDSLPSTPTETPLGRLGRLLGGILPSNPPRESVRQAAESVMVSDAEAHPYDQAKRGKMVAAIPEASTTIPSEYQTFTPPPPASGSRARLFILAALAIALIVPAIVAAKVWVDGRDRFAQAETRIEIATTHVASAQTALDANDDQGALKLLNDARDEIKNGEELLGGPHSKADELRRQIATISRQILREQPLYGLTTPLVQFAAGSRPTRVLVVDQDIYVLDEGRQLVERYRLDTSMEFVPDPIPQTLVKQGDTIDGAQVGTLIDFTWQPPVPGYEDKSNLLILDSNNQVFRFNPRVDGAGLVQLGGREQIKSARQLKTYLGRVYLADVGGNALYRYPPGQYDSAPEAWFAADAPVDLTGLQTLRIDGNIWMLFENGQIMRFFDGKQSPFALDSSLGTVAEPVDLAVSDQEDGNLYLADRAEQRIVVYSKDGTYVSQLRAPEGELLKNLSGLFIEDITDTLYLLTDQYLFKHDLPE